jgi:hypothetical protein
VGDVDRGRPQPLLDPRDLGPHLHAQLGVEVRQRLVHQEHAGVAHDRAAHRHALTLTAREVRRLALQVWLQVEDPRCLPHLLIDLGLRRLGQLQREAHVLAHGHVRVQRVVLKHHRDVPILRRLVVDDGATDLQLAVGDVLQPRHHSQRGRLSAPRRPDQDHQLVVGDVEIEVLDGLVAVAVALGDVLELDLCHYVNAPLIP